MRFRIIKDSRALLGHIRRPHTQHKKRYGVPRMHEVLRQEGWTAGRGRVARRTHRPQYSEP